jgi:hypothetical protein
MTRAELGQARLSALLDGTRNVAVNPFVGVETTAAGINTGAGNQGSANTAMNMGHSGTPASQRGVPRQIKGGSSMLGTV